jgi:hypothetical protein
MLQRHYTVAHKGEKESPVQAIEMEISRGEHGFHDKDQSSPLHH